MAVGERVVDGFCGSNTLRISSSNRSRYERMPSLVVLNLHFSKCLDKTTLPKGVRVPLPIYLFLKRRTSILLSNDIKGEICHSKTHKTNDELWVFLLEFVDILYGYFSYQNCTVNNATSSSSVGSLD